MKNSLFRNATSPWNQPTWPFLSPRTFTAKWYSFCFLTLIYKGKFHYFSRSSYWFSISSAAAAWKTFHVQEFSSVSCSLLISKFIMNISSMLYKINKVLVSSLHPVHFLHEMASAFSNGENVKHGGNDVLWWLPFIGSLLIPLFWRRSHARKWIL